MKNTNCPDVNVFDLHNDLLTDENVADKSRLIAKNRADKAAVVYALYKGKNDLNEILSLYEKAKRLGVKYFAFEDACYLDEKADDEAVTALFNKISECKPLYCSLCWNYENAFAFGAKEDENSPIKPQGLYFMNLLNEADIPVDCAHLNKRGIYEVIEKAKKPVCSHTAFCGVFKNARNLEDDAAEKLVERGGIIGVDCVGYFLTDKRDRKSAVRAFFKNIDYFVQRFGVKGLSIGSDFFGSDFLAFGEDYGVFFNELYNGLSKLALSDEHIRAVSYKNAIDFFFGCS